MDTQKTKQTICNGQQIKTIINSGGVIWSKEPDLPGPKNLIGGSLQAGFYGETPTSGFITGDELARLIGLSAGTGQHSNEPWLKFSYLGNVEYIAKKSFRYDISWDEIKAVNAIFGNRTEKIGGHIYKVRLIKGKTEGKQGDQSAHDGDINRGSEWNKLLLPIHKNAPSSWDYPYNVGFSTEDWGVKYSDDDLFTDNSSGSSSWCQEYGESTALRLLRGGDEVSGSKSEYPSEDYYYYGWRPVLEFVK